MHSRLTNQHNTRGPIRLFNEHKNLHVYNELDIRTSSKNYDKDRYGLDLELISDHLEPLNCFSH